MAAGAKSGHNRGAAAADFSRRIYSLRQCETMRAPAAPRALTLLDALAILPRRAKLKGGKPAFGSH